MKFYYFLSIYLLIAHLYDASLINFCGNVKPMPNFLASNVIVFFKSFYNFFSNYLTKVILSIDFG